MSDEMKDYLYSINSYNASMKKKQINSALRNFGYSGIIELLGFLENLKKSNVLLAYDFTAYTNVAELWLYFSTTRKFNKHYKYLGYSNAKSLKQVTDKLNIRSVALLEDSNFILYFYH